MPYSPANHTAPQVVDGLNPTTGLPGSTALGATLLNGISADLIAYMRGELAALGDYVDSLAPTAKITASTYQFVAGDVAVVRPGNSGALQTFTIPPHTGVPFALGVKLEVLQYGVGQIQIVGGAGVTLRVPAGHVAKTFGQYSGISVWQLAQDEWIAAGDLA